MIERDCIEVYYIRTRVPNMNIYNQFVQVHDLWNTTVQ